MSYAFENDYYDYFLYFILIIPLLVYYLIKFDYLIKLDVVSYNCL